MKLYTYWRSSCSYRVRIALGLKGLAWESAPVHLVRGEHRQAAYRSVNPAGLVPTLELDDDTRLTQSVAIIGWLDATHPEPALMPTSPLDRARMLAAAHTIAMETQPLTSSGVVGHFKAAHGLDAQQGINWMVH